MHENIDGSLASLASEINAMEADRKDGNHSKQIAMGHKLIAVRELLRARDGECRKAAAKDGFPPNGWGKWIKNNLSIGVIHAAKCVRLALDPTGIQAHNVRSAVHRSRPKYHVTAVIRLWPRLDDEQKQRIVNFCFERYNEERTQP